MAFYLEIVVLLKSYFHFGGLALSILNMSQYLTNCLFYQVSDDVLKFLFFYNRFNHIWTLPSTNRQRFASLETLIIDIFKINKNEFSISRIRYDDTKLNRNLLVELLDGQTKLAKPNKMEFNWLTREEFEELKLSVHTSPDVGYCLQSLVP